MVSLCGSEWEPSTQRSQQWNPGWLTAALLPSEVLPGQNFCPLWSNHWKLEMCAGSCAVQMSWGGAGSLPAEVGRGWRLEAEAVAAVGEWVGVFLFSNKSTQRYQRFPVTPVPASLVLLSKTYFSPHLHTYPSLYLNYQHLNFCLSSARALFIQMGMSKCR